jgi:hypothetical protein
MARTLTPFTRLTLMITEMNSNRIEDLADPTRCDLIHHFAALNDEFAESEHKNQAALIGEQGAVLVDSIRSGDFAKAEADRETLIASCKKLKDLV